MTTNLPAAHGQGRDRRSPLAADEERALLARAADGDRAAERALVEAHLRLVLHLVHRMHVPPHKRADAVQEGNLGLLIAIRRFQPGRGVRLSTYAAFWIRAQVMRFLMDDACLVRVGRTREQRRAFFRGELPWRDLSLDGPASSRGDLERPRSLLDTLPTDASSRPDVQLEACELRQRLHAAVAELPVDRRTSALVRERWLSDEPTPLRQLGRRHGITGERARQIEQGLLRHVREALELAEAA